MGVSMKIRLVLAAALLLSAAPAHAQFFQRQQQQQFSKAVLSGKLLILDWLAQVNPDCTNLAYGEIRITQQPQHGRLQIIKTTVFPNFAPSNVRHVCNTRRVPGVEVHYYSEKGFVGTDVVVLEFFTAHGGSRSRRHTISVK
jgi:hypothetical protein